IFGGGGDDLFVWNPGDGSDAIDGGTGFDTLRFNGSNANEHFEISANGAHARFTRDVANIVMDLNGLERIDINALGGTDVIVVNDLSGTDTKQVNIDLSASGGGGDGQIDSVTVNGTAGKDAIEVLALAGSVAVSGLASSVMIAGAEATDQLFVNGLGGADALIFDGSGADENIAISANAGHVSFVSDVAALAVAVDAIGRIDVKAGAGADTVVVNDLSGTDVTSVNIDLGPGHDSLTVAGTASDDVITIESSGSTITIAGLTAEVQVLN